MAKQGLRIDLYNGNLESSKWKILGTGKATFSNLYIGGDSYLNILGSSWNKNGLWLDDSNSFLDGSTWDLSVDTFIANSAIIKTLNNEHLEVSDKITTTNAKIKDLKAIEADIHWIVADQVSGQEIKADKITIAGTNLNNYLSDSYVRAIDRAYQAASQWLNG